MLHPNALEVRRERVSKLDRKHRDSILATLAITHGNLVSSEVQVLDPQSATLEEAQARTVEERRHQPGRPVQVSKHRVGLFSGQDHREMDWPFGAHDPVQPFELTAEHLFVKEEQSAQGLVLSRGAYLAACGKGRYETLDFRTAHFVRMAFSVKDDEPHDPSDVRFLGPGAVVTGANSLPDLVEKARLAGGDRAFGRRTERRQWHLS